MATFYADAREAFRVVKASKHDCIAFAEGKGWCPCSNVTIPEDSTLAFIILGTFILPANDHAQATLDALRR